jgi:type IV pilus assembly protein PilV
VLEEAMKSKSQMGVGLMEVLVALLLLSIAVLGFIALQVKAISASEEAGHNVQAMNLARDLSERMRMNRDGLANYKAGNPAECETVYCTPAQLAVYDYMQVLNRANEQGMDLAILDCQGVNRKCIYVAWGDTIPADLSTNSTSSSEEVSDSSSTESPEAGSNNSTDTAASESNDTDGDESTACTNGTSYVPGAQCVIVEVYGND